MINVYFPISKSKVMEFLTFNIFKVFLGLDYINHPSHEIINIVIAKDDSNYELAFKSKSIIEAEPLSLVSYEFLSMPIEVIYSCSNVPEIMSTFQPVMKGNTIRYNNHSIETDIDIFGLIFFMLSRVEELNRSKLDSHTRFTATSSKAYQHGFLERPIVDEYVEFLWTLMHYLWPTLERKAITSSTIVGCDVDSPYDCSSKKLSMLIRPLIGDVLKRADIPGALNRIKRFINFRVKDEIEFSVDPHYTFDWYMDVVESYGLKATFFFIADNSDGKSGCYSLKEDKIKLLIKKILDRGHHIGLHGSYSSYNNQDKLILEKNNLQNTLDEIGYDYKITESRQHYLRWDPEITIDILDKAGILLDHSGSYADHIGFRYGTAKRFRAFSLTQKKMLNIKIQPLLVMDVSLFNSKYQSLKYNNETAMYIKEIKRITVFYGGSFSILWHNNHFENPLDEQFFKLLMKG